MSPLRRTGTPGPTPSPCMVPRMSESLLDEALGFCRAVIDDIEEGPVRTSLGQRLDVLERAAWALPLAVEARGARSAQRAEEEEDGGCRGAKPSDDESNAAEVVRIAKLVLELRDDVEDLRARRQMAPRSGIWFCTPRAGWGRVAGLN